MSELSAAFLKAQSEFPVVEKDSEAVGTKFSYSYASLPAILKGVLPVLHKNGLSLSQMFDESGNLSTVITHADSGLYAQSVMPMPTALTMVPQDYGKVITYMRRYALVAMLGLAPDDDTDAAGVQPASAWKASSDNKPQSNDNKPSSNKSEAAFDDSILLDKVKANIDTAIKVVGEESYKQWHDRVLSNFYGVDSIGNLNHTQLQDFADKQRVKISESGE